MDGSLMHKLHGAPDVNMQQRKFIFVVILYDLIVTYKRSLLTAKQLVFSDEWQKPWKLKRPTRVQFPEKHD